MKFSVINSSCVVLSFIVLSISCIGCASNETSLTKDELEFDGDSSSVIVYYDPYGNVIDKPFQEYCDSIAELEYKSLSEEDKAGWTDEVLDASSPITEEDYILSNGQTFEEWLSIHDPSYIVGQHR